MPNPTPGQVAYTGYVQTRHGMSEADAALTYARSVPDERAAWEAAAQAVRAQSMPAQEVWQELLGGLEEQIRGLSHEPNVQAHLESLWVVIDRMRRQCHA